MAESLLLKLSKIIQSWANTLHTKYQARKWDLAKGSAVLQEVYLLLKNKF